MACVVWPGGLDRSRGCWNWPWKNLKPCFSPDDSVPPDPALPAMASGALRPSGPTGSPRTLPSGGTVEGGALICLLCFLTAIQGCGRSSSQGCLVTAFTFDKKNVAEPDNRHGASGGFHERVGTQGGACAWARARAGRGSILPYCGENGPGPFFGTGPGLA